MDRCVICKREKVDLINNCFVLQGKKICHHCCFKISTGDAETSRKLSEEYHFEKGEFLIKCVECMQTTNNIISMGETVFPYSGQKTPTEKDTVEESSERKENEKTGYSNLEDTVREVKKEPDTSMKSRKEEIASTKQVPEGIKKLINSREILKDIVASSKSNGELLTKIKGFLDECHDGATSKKYGGIHILLEFAKDTLEQQTMKKVLSIIKNATITAQYIIK